MSKIHIVEPIVFLIDLDGTMIGNILPQLYEYYLIKDINKEIKKVNNEKQIKFNSKILNDELNKYIIRPYLEKFLKKIDKTYENIELFVYTASTPDWAQIIIPYIERITKFKFNRPILSRKNIVTLNDNSYIKSIDKIKPLIYKSLRRKKIYNLNNINDLKYITLIDNTKNILIEKNNLIHCPTFDYRHQIDYLRMVPQDILKKYYIIVEKNLSLDHSTNLYGFYSNYYKLLNEHFKICSEKNNKYLEDKYWYNFLIILKQNISNVTFPELLKVLKNVK